MKLVPVPASTPVYTFLQPDEFSSKTFSKSHWKWVWLNTAKGFLMCKVRENFIIFKTIFTFVIIISDYLKEQSLNAEDFHKV